MKCQGTTTPSRKNTLMECAPEGVQEANTQKYTLKSEKVESKNGLLVYRSHNIIMPENVCAREK